MKLLVINCLVILEMIGIVGKFIDSLVVMVVNLVIIGFINVEWKVCEIVNWWIWWFWLCSWLVIVFIVLWVLEIIIEVGLLIVVMFILCFSIGVILFLWVCIVNMVLLVGNVCINCLCVVISIVVFGKYSVLVMCVVVNLFIEWFSIKFGCIFYDMSSWYSVIFIVNSVGWVNLVVFNRFWLCF